MSEFTWDHVPLLSSPRLHLRALTANDRQDLLAIYGDPAVMQYASDPPFPDLSYVDQMLTSVAALFQQRQSLEWEITLPANGQVIGTCSVHSFNEQRQAAKIGCLMNRSYWGQSLMREALEVVISFGFNTLQLDVLHAEIDAPNTRSLTLFQRLGFQRENSAGTMYTRRKPS